MQESFPDGSPSAATCGCPADRRVGSPDYTVNPDPAFDLPTFCAYVGITERHGRLLVDQERLAVVRIGRRIRIRRSEAERLLAECTAPARRPLSKDGRS